MNRRVTKSGLPVCQPLLHIVLPTIILSFVACDVFQPSEEDRLEPPFVPRLSSKRGDGQVTIRWTVEFSSRLRKYPETHAKPEKIEIFVSETDSARFLMYGRAHVSNDAWEEFVIGRLSGEVVIGGLSNGILYYFKGRAVANDGKASGFSKVIMVMPSKPEAVVPLFDGADYSRSAPAWSPDGKSIVYVTTQYHDEHHSYDLALLSLEDGTSERLNIGIEALHPSWSPEGRSIVFWSLNDLYIYDTDSAAVRQVTANGRTNWKPSWSPDGASIAYVSGIPGSSHQIAKLSLDTDLITILTDVVGSAYDPSWSPDGSRILYSAPVEGDIYSSGIYIMDANGGNRTFVLGGKWGDRCPKWSPDGRQIAFVSGRTGGASELWLFEIPTGRLTQLTGSTITHISGIDWAPSSSQLVVESLTGDPWDSDIYLLPLW